MSGKRAHGRAGESMRGGRPAWRAGDVACSLRDTRTAQYYSRRLGMLHATHHFTVTEPCLLIDITDIRSPVSKTPIAMEKLNR
jgi:hypothetical protein